MKVTSMLNIFVLYLSSLIAPFQALGVNCSDHKKKSYPSRSKYSIVQVLLQDTIGHIACQLCTIIGTPNIVNPKDIKVIVKNIKNFSFTSKNAYTAINSKEVTSALIEALAKRFKINTIDAALELGTPGSLIWINQYVKQHGNYELFKVVQKIFKIAEEVRKEAKEQNLAEVGSGQKDWPGINPYYNQTKQGLFLSIESYPHSLFTPWGEAMLFGGGSGSYFGFLALSQAFLNRLKTVFETTTEFFSNEDKVKFYEIIAPIKREDIDKDKSMDSNESSQYYEQLGNKLLKELSREEVTAKKKQETLIVSDYCGFGSIYKVLAVDQEKLPDPEMQERSKYLSYESAKKTWEIMTEFYKQEQGMESHGMQEVSKSKAVEDRELEKNKCAACGKTQCIDKCSTCKQTYYCSQECYNDHWPQHKVNCQCLLASTINQLPQLYGFLAEQLAAQPLFDGQGAFVEKSKVLPLNSWNDCRICDILTREARKILNNETWPIHDFGGNSQLYSSTGKCIERGITLWIFDSDTMCSIEQLKQAYTTTINKLKNGWSAAHLQDYPDIMFMESEEEWYLFIKKSDFAEEDRLIRFLASKFNLENYISCHNEWLKRESGYKHKDTLYLWVRKDKLEAFTSSFEFNLGDLASKT